MAEQVKKSAAVLTIKHPDQMTAKGRRDIANWLRKHADWLQTDGANYGPRFRARFLYYRPALKAIT